jgi:hypothetical protein
MKCPHCLENFHETKTENRLGVDIEGTWVVSITLCPSCNRLVLSLKNLVVVPVSQGIGQLELKSERLIRPSGINRNPVPVEVPQKFASDYTEASLVIIDSPKASAALSRRCLQSVIREKMGIVKPNLDQEIQEIIDKSLLPTDLLDNVDAIRNIGNFAAHPIKSQRTGEIVDVESNEAEWNLDVLEMLFEFLFVRPAATKKKRDALNSKLSDAGKKPMK